MKKLACFCIAFFLLLAAAGCQGDRDASSSRDSVSSAAASSRPAVSSNPVSSVPPVLSEPLGALNLAFDQRVYVDTFFEDGYFNQNGEWVYWMKNESSAAPNSTAYTYQAAKGKYREYWYQPIQGKEMIQNLKAIVQDAVQLYAAYEPSYSGLSYKYSAVLENGSVIYRSLDTLEDAQKVAAKASQWKDMVFFIDYNNDAVGLKKDGTIQYEPYPRVEESYDPFFWRLSQIFTPEIFTDIIAVASQNIFESHLQNWKKDDFLFLLRKDGVLFNVRGEVVYRNVERLFPAADNRTPSFALLSTGELIRLDDKVPMGFPQKPDRIVSVRQLQWGTYALMEDGSFQTIACDEADNLSREYQKIIYHVTDCKTT